MATITILQMAFSFTDDIGKIVFLYMNCIYIQIVLNFIPNGPIDNISYQWVWKWIVTEQTTNHYLNQWRPS